SPRDLLLVRAVLHVLVPEPALHAEVAARDPVIERRGDLHDRVVLHVQLQAAADAAVGADRLGHGLLALVPGAVLAHVVLALEHQRAGRADRDAVAAVDAGRVGERGRILGRDAGVEPASGHRDRKGVLPVGAAALDALVAEDAFRVVADVALVVHLHGLGDGRGRLAVTRVVVPGLGAVARALRCGRGRRAVPLGLRLVLLHPAVHVRRRGQVDAGCQELEHHLAAVAYALGVGLDNHAVLGLACAARHQHARALDLDHTHAARVDRREGVAVAERRLVASLRAAGIEDGRALADADALTVDLELHGAADGDGDDAHSGSLGL